jgi:hypothetical protein
MSEKLSWKHAWEIAGHVSTLQTLWQLAAAFIATSRVIANLPSGWYPPQYWASAGAAFFVTWAVAATLTAVVKWGVTGWRRRRDPSTLVLEPGGGSSGVVTLRHSGWRSRIRVEGRIVRALDGSPNPRAEPFEARMSFNSQYLREIVLDGKQWAVIHLSGVGLNQFHGNTWLEIRHGGFDINVPDAGVEIELTVTMDEQQIVRRFAITRGAGRLVNIIALDVS